MRNHRRLAFLVILGVCLAGAIGSVIWGVSVGCGHLGWSSDVESLAKDNVRRIPSAMAAYSSRRLSTTDYPWVLFHGILGRARDYDIAKDGGGRVGCMEWLFTVLARGEGGYGLVAKTEYGYGFVHGSYEGVYQQHEDHPSQFTFILSECGLDPDSTKLLAPPDGRPVSLREMVETEMNWCHGVKDVSWGLPVFLRWGRHEEWTNRYGKSLSITGLVRQHLDRERMCGSCWGTHWKMGLAIAVREGKGRIGGDVYEAAARRMEQAIEEARHDQDANGRFALRETHPGRSPGGEPVRRSEAAERSDSLSYQGHMVEWLAVALSDEEIVSGAMIHKAVACMLDDLERHGNCADVPYGAHSHCIAALRKYEGRVRKAGASRAEKGE